MGKKRLGEFLVESGLISEEGLSKALAEQRSKRGKLGEMIVTLGLATDAEIAQALSIQLGIPLIDLQNTPVEPQAIELINEKVARKHLIVPVSIEQKELHIAMADPLSFEAFEDVRFASGYTIRPFLATRTDILWAIDQHYHLGSSLTNIVKDIADERMVEVVGDRLETDSRDVEDLRKKSEAAPVIRMVNAIISEAAEKGASDIHIEPVKTALQIRNRIDGLLTKTMDLPKWVQGAVISRVKIMAKMDIAEKRLPQDGRIGVRIGGKSLDLRISTIPANYGEKVVIRLLDSANAGISLDAMGLNPSELSTMEDIINRPQGIILVTGPTGSGKTTTLYGILNRIKTVTENITTIEDPIEYELSGINQVAVQEKIGLSFPSMLRSLLRQDPDIIMVGEMRDAGNGLHRGPGGPHRAPRLLDDPHQQLRRHGDPAARPGDPLLPHRHHDHRDRRPAAGPDDLPEMQGEAGPDGTRDPAAGAQAQHPGLPRRGMPPLQRDRVQGKDRHLRDPGVHAADPRSDRLERDRERDPPDGDLTGHGDAGAQRPRQGGLGRHHGGRGVPWWWKPTPTSASACPQCATPLEAEFIMCPSCGYSVVSVCPGCRRTLSQEWKFCPYCRQDLLKRETKRTFA